MKKAFTLAEVIITLMILGVIAVVTVPGLLQKTYDKETITQVKAAYSMLSRAMARAVGENGPVSQWEWHTGSQSGNNRDNRKSFMKVLIQYMNVKKYCGSATCFPNNYGGSGVAGYPLDLRGNKYTNGGSIEGFHDGKTILNNGMYLMVWNGYSQHSETVANIVVDINGAQGPNRIGYDWFHFTVGQTRIAPTTSNDCYKNANYGWGCSKYVIDNGNMNYKY